MVRLVNVPPQKVYGGIEIPMNLETFAKVDKHVLAREWQDGDPNFPLYWDAYESDLSNQGGLLGFAPSGNFGLVPTPFNQPTVGNHGAIPAGLGYIGAVRRRTNPVDPLATQLKRQAAADAAKAKREAAIAAAAEKRLQRKTDAKTRKDDAAEKRIKKQEEEKKKKEDQKAKKDSQKAMSDCAKQAKAGYIWDGSTGKCVSPQQQCSAQSGYWNGTACVGKNQQDCASSGGTWDQNTGTCLTLDVLAQQQCVSSGGIWDAALKACKTPSDPNAPPPPAPSAPPQNYGGGGSGGGGGGYMGPPSVEPIGDGGYGGEYGGFAPGFPQSQFQHQMQPQMQSQIPQIPITSDQDDSGVQAMIDSAEQKIEATSDLENVAEEEIKDSQKMAGLYGLMAPQNAQKQRVMATAPAEYRQSTVNAVIATAAVLVIGSVALWAWQKGK